VTLCETGEDVMKDREKEAESCKDAQPAAGQGIALGAGAGVALGAGIGAAVGNIAIGAGIGVALRSAIGMLLAQPRQK